MGCQRIICFLLLLLIVGPIFSSCVSTPQVSQGDLLPALKDYRALRVSSHDRSGGNADALQVAPGETAVLADLEGPGMITHIWVTIAAEKFHGRKIVLRMYWDDEEDPSVLCPINDFFCAGHGLNAEVRSLPITVTSEGRARNCFFPMPFNRRARIEITNEGQETIGAFYYYIDYRKYPRPLRDMGYFHARYRQEYPAVPGRHYMICDARGRGHFVGCNLSIESNSSGWWGEGDDRFFIDGESSPSLHGTGSEDYLCDAWGIWEGDSPYYGCSIFEGPAYVYEQGTRFTSYRFHLADPVPFEKSLLLEIEHYGARQNANGGWEGFVERADNWSSVAYWYQSEPHKPWEALPPLDQRLPREAGDEIEMLRFLRDAEECSSEEQLESLRKTYRRLMEEGRQEASVRVRLTMRMASAEQACGQPERARSLVAPWCEPFMRRDAADDIRRVLGDDASSSHRGTPLLVAAADGSVEPQRQGGRPCIVTQKERGRPYVYFALPEEAGLSNRDLTVKLRITYYSDGQPGRSFRVHYDSHYSDDLPGYYRETQEVLPSPSPGWHTVEVVCPRARLAGHQNERADFRVAALGGQDVFIGGIEIEAVK